MAAATPIFRHIEITRGQRIVLGEPFVLNALSVARGQNERELLPRAFGGAESIVIELTPSGVVRGMRFRYEAGTPLQQMVDGYKTMLGPPTVEEHRDVVWEDAVTVFELWQEGERASEPAIVMSRLSDRMPVG